MVVKPEVVKLEINLTDIQVARIKDLMEIMDQRRSVIGMTIPGDAERTRAWREYDEAQKELIQMLPLATEPLE